MLLDRALYERIVGHSLAVIEKTAPDNSPFPHLLLQGIFPADVFQRLLAGYPPVESFVKANPKHHSNEYGGSTRQRMTLSESALQVLPDSHHMLWATIRAAISCRKVRDAIFLRLSTGLCRQFRCNQQKLPTIPAYPRGQLYSEVEGYCITPHPDTREKIVTMQFAFPSDDTLMGAGTEFYIRSFNPMHLLREPRGFTIAKAMPFLPNHAYAFSVLNDLGLKSWHGRSTLPPTNCVRNSLLHIWYAERDETDEELQAYQRFLQSPPALRKIA